jgi:hypothetical protein
VSWARAHGRVLASYWARAIDGVLALQRARAYNRVLARCGARAPSRVLAFFWARADLSGSRTGLGSRWHRGSRSLLGYYLPF